MNDNDGERSKKKLSIDRIHAESAAAASAACISRREINHTTVRMKCKWFPLTD